MRGDVQLNAHENSGELRDWTAELRRLRDQVQAIAGGTAAVTPALSVVDANTDGFPVIRPAMPRRYADGGQASA